MPPRNEDIMRFPQIASTIEGTFNDQRGFLCENLDRAVAECARRANEYQGKSVLTLQVTFEPKGQDMTISSSLKVTTPTPSNFPIRAFIDREGNLVGEDPRQMKLIDPAPFARQES